MVEHIEGASYIDFKGCSDILGFLFLLFSEQVIQILQNRHILRARVIQVSLINQAHTAVDDGFLHRLQSVLTAYDQLTQAENEVRLEGQRAFIVRVIQVQVHRIDVVG